MRIVRAAKDNINRVVQVFKLVRSNGSSGTGLPVGGTDGQFLQKSGTANFIAQWFTLTKAYLGLGNVTDDAQLKRSAGDFQAFTQKITPTTGDSVLIEDGSDGQNKKRALIDSFLSGGGGGINYDSPIVLTGSITPNDGDFFTTDRKKLNLTGSGGEKFWPNGGATSRVIWGTGVVAALTVNIDPSSLGVGGIFEIALDEGESRRMRYDGTDFIKIGGVVIPLECQAYHTGAVQITVPHNTLTPISTLGSTVDNSGQMHEAGGSGGINAIRSGQYESHNRLGYTGVTSGTTHTIFSRMLQGSTLMSDINTFILSDDSVGVFTRASPPMVTLTAGNLYELKALQLDKGGTSSIKVHSSASGQEQRNYMHLIERNPW